jgi:hypothetical protein
MVSMLGPPPRPPLFRSDDIGVKDWNSVPFYCRANFGFVWTTSKPRKWAMFVFVAKRFVVTVVPPVPATFCPTISATWMSGVDVTCCHQRSRALRDRARCGRAVIPRRFERLRHNWPCQGHRQTDSVLARDRSQNSADELSNHEVLYCSAECLPLAQLRHRRREFDVMHKITGGGDHDLPHT